MRTATRDSEPPRHALRALLEGCRSLLAQTEGIVRHYAGYARLMRLHQPIGIWLLLWPTLWAVWLAGNGRPSEQVLVVFVLGTIVVRSAGCIINDFADRAIDPHVARTRNRPLASGEVTVAEALVLFAGLMLIALGLALTMNPLTQALALVGALITVVYPFTKRFLSAPQFVLGIAFAWGVPMAFAAELGEVTRVGWLLFVAAVTWGVIYDTEYAMADRDDDLKIGVRSTAILLGDLDRSFIGILQALFFLSMILVGRSESLGRWFYGSLALAAVLALFQQYLIRDREPVRCFRAFLSNAWLGGIIFVGLVLDFVFRSS
jgi:4-hydroxybenzoate polyprenyltransferase